MEVVAAVIATHMLVGTAICAAFAKAAGVTLRLGLCFVAALAASVVSGIVIALLFSVSGLGSLPGGFMEGGLVTLLLTVGVFTFLWLVAAALMTPRIARLFSAQAS